MRLNMIPCCAVLALMLAACGGAPAPTQSAAATQPNDTIVNAALPTTTQVIAETPTPAPALERPVSAQGEPLVARVNEIEITNTRFERTLARFESQQLVAADPLALRQTVLETMIEQALIEQAALDLEINVTDTEIDSEVDANRAMAGSAEAWNAWLAANLYTEEEFREAVRSTLLTNRVRDAVTQSMSGDVPQVHARHIVVTTEAEAVQVLDRLRSGEDFAALALEYSRDVTTREQGGDLGWFTEGSLLEPYLAQVLFSLQPGEIAGPVPTSLGYHVVQTLEKENRPVPEQSRASAMQNVFERWLATQYQNAEIERYI